MKPMTKKELQLACKLLNFARTEMLEGKTSFVCFAIESAAHKESYLIASQYSHSAIYKVSKRLGKWVERMLAGHFTYGTWLREVYKINTQGMKQQHRNSRVAWIDYMIMTLESDIQKV